jgi:hypothetical protein
MGTTKIQNIQYAPLPPSPKGKKLGLLVPFLIGQKFFSHGYIGYSLYLFITYIG